MFTSSGFTDVVTAPLLLPAIPVTADNAKRFCLKLKITRNYVYNLAGQNIVNLKGLQAV